MKYPCDEEDAMTIRKCWIWVVVLTGWLMLGVPMAHAQFAVVDVGAIAQLMQQVQTLREQLETTRDQLSQARQQYESMTGGRGMQQLLAGTVRNYLPPDWAAIEQVLEGAAGGYGALAADLQRLIDRNAVLTARAVAALAPTQREQLEAARREAALRQALTRSALRIASERFASIQQLIAAIGGAGDSKAILDLQARIAAEQGMLQNEAIKLDVLYQAAQAEQWARHQQLREQAIADIGSLRDLPPMDL
jgi:type IV secretion system protein VirB5